MKNKLFLSLFCLSSCALFSQSFKPFRVISKSTYIICRDTTINRIAPLNPGSNLGIAFLICKGVKVHYTDTNHLFHNDTFKLMENAKLYFDSFPVQPAGSNPAILVLQEPFSYVKNTPGRINLEVRRDSLATAEDKNGNPLTFAVYVEHWDTLKNGIYYDFKLWPNGMNPCCKANTASMEGVSKSGFDIFPNPGHHGFCIRVNDMENQEIEVSIFSLNGALLQNQIVTNPKAIFINTSLNPGLYLVRIKTREGYLTKRLQIE